MALSASHADFRDMRTGEHRRRPLPPIPVNKGLPSRSFGLRSRLLGVPRVQQTIDEVHALPQALHAVPVRAPIDGIAHPEAGQEVARRGLLGEREATPPWYLLWQVRMRLAHQGDLRPHLFRTENLVVEADGDVGTLGTNPRQHPRAHGREPESSKAPKRERRSLT